MSRAYRHPVFAAFWDRATRHEGPAIAAQRDAVASGARGTVLEIGIGAGSNWKHLPAGICCVGIEPDPAMLGRARHHRAMGLSLGRLLQAAAEALPFADASFDTVISTLTLCSVRDPGQTVAEIRRVLRPGGEFRFWEHTRPRNRAGALLTDLVRPAWERAGGGCQPNRRVIEAIEAGFDIQELQEFRMLLPMVRGRGVVSGTEEASP